jgi:hypothetical protein
VGLPAAEENGQPDTPKQSFLSRRKRWAQECDAGTNAA